MAIIEVTASSGNPVAFYGQEFIRVGSYKKKLENHPEKEEQIWKKKNRTSFEEQIAFEGVDEQKLFKLLDYPKYFDLLNRPLPAGKDLFEQLENEYILKKSSSSEWGITNLGAILLARDISSFKHLIGKGVRVIVYDGKGKTKGLKEQEGVKGYAIGLEGLIDFVNAQLPISEEIGPVFRKQIKLYPEVAIRELATNMLMHQDFEVSEISPRIEIFDGRIEFTNPGKPTLDTLRFIDQDKSSRNKRMARIFRKMNFCEERGSGIDKVITEVEFHQLPAPEFVEEDYYFKAILYAPKKLKDMSREDKIRACYQHCCLKYILGEKMTNKGLRERFKIEQKNGAIVSRIIADTISAGLIASYDMDNSSKKFASYIPFWA